MDRTAHDQTIDTIAQRIRSLVPRAKVAVGHGQMGSDDLARENQRRPSLVELHEMNRPH
jgi:hypothetical protein